MKKRILRQYEEVGRKGGRKNDGMEVFKMILSRTLAFSIR